VANLLVLVSVIAVGLAAMRDASVWTERTVFTVMFVVLMIGLLGSLVRRANPGGVGFAVFGWVYALVQLIPTFREEFNARLLTSPLLDYSAERLLKIPPEPKPLGFDVIRPNGGKYGEIAMAKWIDGRTSPMTTAEAELAQEWHRKSSLHWAALSKERVRLQSAHRIGHSFFALIFGLIGASLGRLVATLRTARATHPTSENPIAKEQGQP
jgi:hypothetical protein